MFGLHNERTVCIVRLPDRDEHRARDQGPQDGHFFGKGLNGHKWPRAIIIWSGRPPARRPEPNSGNPVYLGSLRVHSCLGRATRHSELRDLERHC